MTHEHDPEESVEVPSGWGIPKPAHIPRPTYWPAVLALGVAFIFWGLATTLIISGLGVILFVVGAAGWIGELLHES